MPCYHTLTTRQLPALPTDWPWRLSCRESRPGLGLTGPTEAGEDTHAHPSVLAVKSTTWGEGGLRVAA